MGMRSMSPTIGPDPAPFWRYAESGELRMQACATCGHLRWPPSPICPECWSMEVVWKRLSGFGRVQSWIVYQRQYLDQFPTPHLVALVELDEGPRMETSMPQLELMNIYRGMPVAVTFEQHDDVSMPYFAPRSEGEGS